MKTFISDLIPKIQRYSQQLDNQTLLTNQHWVVVDDNTDTKHVYIFRSNNELLISQNGRVEKAKWEYLSHDTLLIDRKDESILFRHGFFDENILALKTDGKSEYALLVNETKYNSDLNSSTSVLEFLQKRYISRQDQPSLLSDLERKECPVQQQSNVYQQIGTYHTNKGIIKIHGMKNSYTLISGSNVSLNDQPAPDGKYKLDFFWCIHVKCGKLVKESLF
jgi:hypothetical protein